MKYISLKIPENTCKECPYLKTVCIDYAYYGETSIHTTCRIFEKKITECQPCRECREFSQEGYSLKEVNQIAKEMHNKGIIEAMEAIKERIAK